MLQLIAHIIIISIICFIWGLPVLLFSNKKNITDSFWIRGTAGLFCFLYFSGLLTIGFIASWLCLFLPMNFSLLILLTIVPLSISILKRNQIAELIKLYSFRFTLSIIEWCFVVVCIGAFIIPGILKPVNGDTQIYHVQIIRWFNEYGAVPGIANLFPRFGLGSNWFNLIGLFRIPAFSYENFSWLNTTTVIWFFIWLINSWKFHAVKNDSSANSVMSHFYLFVTLFCLFEWELFRDAASSTNYDFIVTALSLIAISFQLESILLPAKEKSFSYLFIILCLSVIPFKLSGIFLGLIILFYLSGFLKMKYWTASFTAAILIITPFLIKNHITTGYPVFPVPVSINNPDWKVPEEMTNYLRQYIHVTNRFYNSYTVNSRQIPELMHESWVQSWIKGLLLQQKLIICLSLLSVFIFVVKPLKQLNHISIRILFACLLLMTAGWFFSAPSPRFGYGVLMVLAFFPFCYLFGAKLTRLIHQPLIILTFFITIYYLYKKAQPVLKDSSYLIHTAKLEQPPLKTITIDGVKFNLPEIINNGWMRDCFNTDLPCISVQNPYLQPRGETLKQGFKMEPKPDSIFIRNYIY